MESTRRRIAKGEALVLRVLLTGGVQQERERDAYRGFIYGEKRPISTCRPGMTCCIDRGRLATASRSDCPRQPGMAVRTIPRWLGRMSCLAVPAWRQGWRCWGDVSGAGRDVGCGVRAWRQWRRPSWRGRGCRRGITEPSPLETTLGVGKKNNQQGTQIQWGTGGCGKKTKDIFEEIYTSCLDIHVKKFKKKRNIGTKIGNWGVRK
jgi:hypothetical protein